MPMPEGEVSSAREAISRLFGQMGIERVVCVDDIYSHSVKVEATIALCMSAEEGALDNIR